MKYQKPNSMFNKANFHLIALSSFWRAHRDTSFEDTNAGYDHYVDEKSETQSLSSLDQGHKIN